MTRKSKALLLFLTDVFVAAYTYFTLANYERFEKMLTEGHLLPSEMNGPDFKLEFFKLFIQTLAGISFIVIGLHAVIFLLYAKEKKFAIHYAKYYSILAGLSLLLTVLSIKDTILLLPATLYIFIYFQIRKEKIN